MVDATSTIIAAAKRHGLNASHFLAVANCEDPGLIPDQQSNYIRQDGTREPSFGIFQISKEFHPEVSIASSTNIEWAANWAANQWELGHESEWSCYRKYEISGWPVRAPG